MTALSDFIATIRGYTGFLDPTVQTDAQITAYIRNGEARINESLRIADMVTISGNLVIASGEVPLPSNWIANDSALIDGVEFDWTPRSDYYKLTDKSSVYTTSGNHMIVDTQYNALNAVLHYFADIPPLTDPISWPAQRFPQLLTDATMVYASMGMIEDDRGGEWEQMVKDTIGRLNDRYVQSQGWGTRMTKQVKGFG